MAGCMYILGVLRCSSRGSRVEEEEKKKKKKSSMDEGKI